MVSNHCTKLYLLYITILLHKCLPFPGLQLTLEVAFVTFGIQEKTRLIWYLVTIRHNVEMLRNFIKSFSVLNIAH